MLVRGGRTAAEGGTGLSWKEGAEGRGERPDRGQTPSLTSSATLGGKFATRYSDRIYLWGSMAPWEGHPRQEETLHSVPEDNGG